MRKGKVKIPWLENAVKEKQDDWGLKIKCTQSKHIKVEFTDANDVKWVYVTSISPSDKRARHTEIRIIKKNLKSKFNIDASNDDFTMQLAKKF